MAIEATSVEGATLHFDAQRTGAAGHWTATVKLPAAGAWQWRVDMPGGLQVSSKNFADLSVVGTTGLPPNVPMVPIALAAAAAALLIVGALWRSRRLRVTRRGLSGEPQRP